MGGDDGKKLPFGDGLPTYLLQESLGPALAPPLATPLATPLAPPLAPPMNFAKTLRIYRELSTNHNSLLIMVMVMVMESPTESPPQHRQRNRPRPRNCHNFLLRSRRPGASLSIAQFSINSVLSRRILSYTEGAVTPSGVVELMLGQNTAKRQSEL